MNHDSFHIILFDGECNLCNRAIDLLIRLDSKGVFKIASLQSRFGKKILDESGYSEMNPETILLKKNNRFYIKSNAVIEIIKELKWYWRILLIVRVLPFRLRDGIYDIVAENRFKWFGRRQTCRKPTDREREFFIE